MKIVGEQLEAWAKSQMEFGSKDLFGRSAFNRYYYSAYLTTREMLGDLNGKWRRTNHSDTPNLLLKGVREPVIRQLEKDHKSGRITKTEMGQQRRTLQVSTTELSNLLIQAYALRGIADYEPEVHVRVEGTVISLDSYKLNSARGWPDRANGLCKSIRKSWKDSGLAK